MTEPAFRKIQEGLLEAIRKAKTLPSASAGSSGNREIRSDQILAQELPKSNPYDERSMDALRVEIQWIDAKMARHLRDTCAFEWQRKISDRNVARLAAEMKKGWFVAGTPITVAVLPDNSMRLLNGNHTMEAIHASGVSVPLTFIYSRVRDLHEAGKIYATLDIQRVRTWADSLQATGKGDFPLGQKAMSAIGLVMQDFVFTASNMDANASRNARFEVMEDYRVAASIIEKALNGAPAINRRIMSRAAILSVALATARYQPSTAAEFWHTAAFDDGLSRNDPRKALLTYGMNNRSRSGTDNNVHSRAAALAWNAYFEGRALEYCKPNQTQEFRLLGTPWSARRKVGAIETGVMVGTSGMKPVTLFRDAAGAH